MSERVITICKDSFIMEEDWEEICVTFGVDADKTEINIVATSIE